MAYINGYTEDTINYIKSISKDTKLTHLLSICLACIYIINLNTSFVMLMNVCM